MALVNEQGSKTQSVMNVPLVGNRWCSMASFNGRTMVSGTTVASLGAHQWPQLVAIQLDQSLEAVRSIINKDLVGRSGSPVLLPRTQFSCIFLPQF